MNDSAVGDPASNGITVILAGMTYWWDRRFTTNMKDELFHLSMRCQELQTAPSPLGKFISYYGAFSSNKTLVAVYFSVL